MARLWDKVYNALCGYRGSVNARSVVGVIASLEQRIAVLEQRTASLENQMEIQEISRGVPPQTPLGRRCPQCGLDISGNFINYSCQQRYGPVGLGPIYSTLENKYE